MREIVHLQAGQCGNQIGAKVLFLWTWSQAPWTLCDPARLVRSSGRTTLSLVRVELAITGQKATTRRVPSWWTPCWTW
uniref:Tubulin/FtsZ GTPase domain-containing protein n=1 Tax=Scleropages formosus TaxID=113540 RepID=A0A8C9WL50_SCLFO